MPADDMFDAVPRDFAQAINSAVLCTGSAGLHTSAFGNCTISEMRSKSFSGS